ncbi:hypothetical protein Ancab_003880, partial [Ancistrocladus abbreviatus]
LYWELIVFWGGAIEVSINTWVGCVGVKYRNLVLNAHSIEGKWIHGGCLPPVEEYMAIALISAGITWFPILYYVGMAITTQATFDWVCTRLKICKASAIICRLLDDLAPYQDGDWYSDPYPYRDCVSSLLIDPVVV